MFWSLILSSICFILLNWYITPISFKKYKNFIDTIYFVPFFFLLFHFINNIFLWCVIHTFFSFAAPICCSSVRNEECRTACQTVRVQNSKLHIFMLEGQLCKEPREGKNSEPLFLTEGDNSVGILSQVFIQLNPVSKPRMKKWLQIFYLHYYI